MQVARFNGEIWEPFWGTDQRLSWRASHKGRTGTWRTSLHRHRNRRSIRCKVACAL